MGSPRGITRKHMGGWKENNGHGERFMDIETLKILRLLLSEWCRIGLKADRCLGLSTKRQSNGDLVAASQPPRGVVVAYRWREGVAEAPDMRDALSHALGAGLVAVFPELSDRHAHHARHAHPIRRMQIKKQITDPPARTSLNTIRQLVGLDQLIISPGWGHDPSPSRPDPAGYPWPSTAGQARYSIRKPRTVVLRAYHRAGLPESTADARYRSTPAAGSAALHLPKCSVKGALEVLCYLTRAAKYIRNIAMTAYSSRNLPLSDRSNSIDAVASHSFAPTSEVTSHHGSKRNLFSALDSSEATPSEHSSIPDAEHVDTAEAGEAPSMKSSTGKRSRSRSASWSDRSREEKRARLGGQNFAVRFKNRPNGTPLMPILEQKSRSTLRSKASTLITQRSTNAERLGANSRYAQSAPSDAFAPCIHQISFSVDENTLQELREVIDSRISSASEEDQLDLDVSRPLSPPEPPAIRRSTPDGATRWPGDLPTSRPGTAPATPASPRSFATALRALCLGFRANDTGPENIENLFQNADMLEIPRGDASPGRQDNDVARLPRARIPSEASIASSRDSLRARRGQISGSSATFHTAPHTPRPFSTVEKSRERTYSVAGLKGEAGCSGYMGWMLRVCFCQPLGGVED
ncbi:hypothetical protein K490DRAFT_54946 [Saccharata proteae CBS 121410]|uniref:Uncharacterized protein n=1 Tax=Saccharata proteae CBS 121410 TaxID=1314787 RepID=A0A6A5YCC4_9PEZI|nr:hypothetical protein K490DRAFT_54946 [Saccharata proteae CBS 121410]